MPHNLLFSLPGPKIVRRGIIFVLSSPSGAGKTTISRLLLEHENTNSNEKRLEMSVSVTTRPRRSNEVDGRDYRFVDQETFECMAKNHTMLEYAKVFNNWYGTPRAPVEAALDAGCDVLFDVDWQGAQQLREAIGGDMVSVFILPPSMGELERRLRTRAQDSDYIISRRMTKAGDEIRHWKDYDYVLVNWDIQLCLEQIIAILKAERLRLERQTALPHFIANLLNTSD